MKRTMIKIDQEKCNGCGLCVEGCHEGALQLIDGKAVMISEMFCDGLGACIGECPQGAIELEEREAELYNEVAVMEKLITKGNNVIIAHLKHMKEHNEMKYFNQGIDYLKLKGIDIDLSELINNESEQKQTLACGCPGTLSKSFQKKNEDISQDSLTQKTELTHWPIQLHLQNPNAGYFHGANLLLAADCTAFSLGTFHPQLLKNKVLSIACPKLDSNKEKYVEKMIEMIDVANIDTLTVAIMEVPCCSGLLQLATLARENAKRNIPIKSIVISIQGDIISDKWI